MAVVAPSAVQRGRTLPRSVPTRLEEAITRVRRRYGAVALRRGGEPLADAVWATGVPVLDALTGCGGLPRGRLSVVAAEGAGASGRLSLLQALTAAASRETQVAYLDLAGSLDPGFLADLGADLDACLVVRPEGGAVAPGLAMARALVRAGVPWLAVALGRPPRARPWGPADAVEHAVTALVGAVEAAGAVACVAAPAPLPAALAYASSLTLGCARAGWLEANGDVSGLRLRLELCKSKLGAPGALASLAIRYPRPWGEAGVLGLPSLVAPAAWEWEPVPGASARPRRQWPGGGAAAAGSMVDGAVALAPADGVIAERG